MEFNTQICTDKEQSKRLIDLGLKIETADVKLIPYTSEAMSIDYNDRNFLESDLSPAWSLHRLIAMLPLKIEDDYSTESFLKIEGSNIVYKERDMFIYNSFEKDNIYDNIIDCIEWLVKDEYFNKEYLKNEICICKN